MPMSKLFGFAKRVGKYVTRGQAASGATGSASTNYLLIESNPSAVSEAGGWHEPEGSERQDAAYRDLIQEMHAGRVRRDLAAAADAVRLTGLLQPSMVEVGCGSGYYSEILPHLLQQTVSYTGVDSSRAMLRLARRR